MNHIIVSKLLEEKSKFILYNEYNLNDFSDQNKDGELYDNVIETPKPSEIETPKDTNISDDTIPSYWI